MRGEYWNCTAGEPIATGEPVEMFERQLHPVTFKGPRGTHLQYLAWDDMYLEEYAVEPGIDCGVCHR